ncbi:MAG: dephospho-CoA kinase, partial [Rubripirellula sp.]
MIVLGIVGTPAGGKSTVAERLAELGAAWINADLIAKEVLERPDVQADLKQYYGASVVDKHGMIDRAKLAAMVFGDDDESRRRLDYLERRIHPETRKLITAQLLRCEKQGDAVAILDVDPPPVVVPYDPETGFALPEASVGATSVTANQAIIEA